MDHKILYTSVKILKFFFAGKIFIFIFPLLAGYFILADAACYLSLSLVMLSYLMSNIQYVFKFPFFLNSHFFWSYDDLRKSKLSYWTFII